MYNTVSQHMESLITVRPLSLCPAPANLTSYTSSATDLKINTHCAIPSTHTHAPPPLRLQNGCEDLLKKLDVKPNIDRLHAVVTEARARKQAGYTGKDVWTESLHPSAAARAQIVPLLVDERDRLKAQLAEVRRVSRFRPCVSRG